MLHNDAVGPTVRGRNGSQIAHSIAHCTRAPVFWRAHGKHERAINKPLRRRTTDSTASLRN
eukprot:1763301-Lingulodinium_polyedra.AAC.1